MDTSRRSPLSLVADDEGATPALDAGVSDRPDPQLKQNLLPASLAVPHDAQDRPSPLPQLEQKECSAEFSAPQLLQLII